MIWLNIPYPQIKQVTPGVWVNSFSPGLSFRACPAPPHPTPHNSHQYVIMKRKGWTVVRGSLRYSVCRGGVTAQASGAFYSKVSPLHHALSKDHGTARSLGSTPENLPIKGQRTPCPREMRGRPVTTHPRHVQREEERVRNSGVLTPTHKA